jgi:hypothetical protein
VSTRADVVDFGATITPAEQEFGSDLYDLLARHGFEFPKGKFFGRGFVIMRTIEAIREEAGPDRSAHQFAIVDLS